jgi:hypothetical protein
VRARRAFVLVSVVALLIIAGSAMAGGSQRVATAVSGPCAAIDRNYDYLESIASSSSQAALYETREAAAQAANQCPADVDSGDPDDVPSTTTTSSTTTTTMATTTTGAATTTTFAAATTTTITFPTTTIATTTTITFPTTTIATTTTIAFPTTTIAGARPLP